MSYSNDGQSRKREKNQHIQVFVRVRPPNAVELMGKSPSIVEVAQPRDIIVKERPQDKFSKKFSFDRVFGPESKQLDVYNAVARPLLEEVLAGYNCTVFAYGQTGTGKTFTMEGASNDPAIHWQSDTSAGLIPRALSQLFDELRSIGSQEYTVRVSFLELYNEELFDLLSPTEDASKIRIFEDASKKGAVIIHGLEEVTVHNKNEVYKILENGSQRRQTAATLMNAHSSRSHTVFSITVHIKENTLDGEELLKTGKLNLVDLAGSENVGRSGAVDRRAREAGNINQSLLTLGRVITALVERTPHIPYRESKLTRLLQESLGGRTKTSIIATVSPASINLEETLSTLDYAHRAKNITNRPEINQKLSKKALLKEYTEEIERLRRDLQAARERNGVYLAQENYNEMQTTIEFQGKEIEEKINHIKALEDTMAAKEKLLEELHMDLLSTKKQVKITAQDRDEQRHLVEKHLETESKLSQQAKNILNIADLATTDTYRLHEKIERKSRIEQVNQCTAGTFKENISTQFETIQKNIKAYSQELTNFYSSSKNNISTQFADHSTKIDLSMQRISKDFLKEEQTVTGKLVEHYNMSQEDYQKWIEEQIKSISTFRDTECEVLKKIAVDFAPKIKQLCETNISQNLRLVNDETVRNLDTFVDITEKCMDNIFNMFLQYRDNLQCELESLKSSLQHSLESQTALTKKNEKLSQLFKTFQDGFETIRSEQDAENSRIVDSVQTNLESCVCMDSELIMLSSNQETVKLYTDNDMVKQVEDIKSTLSSNLQLNWELAEKSIEQGKVVTASLQDELNGNCDRLTIYSDEVVTRMRDFNERTESAKSTAISLVADIDAVVLKAANDHEKFMEDHRHQLREDTAKIKDELEKQRISTSGWCDDISSHLNEAHEQIDKFVAEDLKRDVPTGSTPAKREFKYPRDLAATSPHDKILNRFRSLCNQKNYDSPDCDQVQLNTASDFNRFAVPMAVRSSSSSLSAKSRPLDDDSRNALSKSASASDISDLRDRSPPDFSIDEMDLNGTPRRSNDKENSDEIVTVPTLKPSKYGFKPKSASKRILASRNDL